jgi:hypothetical protein
VNRADIGNVAPLGSQRRGSWVEMLTRFLEGTSERQSVNWTSEEAVGIMQRDYDSEETVLVWRCL